MALIDLTRPLTSGMVVYPGDPPFAGYPMAHATRREPNSHGMWLLVMSSHSGTHLDAPAHFVEGGQTVDQIPLDILCGKVRVVDARKAGRRITAAFLRRLDLDGAERLVLRTCTGHLRRFTPDFAGLTSDAATWLRAKGVRLVGTDNLSIETGRDSRGRLNGFPVHHCLLAGPSPTYLLEGLDLSRAPRGDFTCGLLCLPLKAVGADGAPVRAALRVG